MDNQDASDLKTVRFRQRRKWLIGGIVMVGMGVLLVILLQGSPQPSLPPVIILPAMQSLPEPRVSLLDRVMPQSAGWGWLWRVRYSLLGQPKGVLLVFSPFEFDTLWQPENSSVLANHEPVTRTNAVRVWVLNEEWLAALRTESQALPLASARLSTAENVLSSMSVELGVPKANGLRHVRLAVDTWPRLLDHVVDLTTRIVVTEELTNEPPATSGMETNAVITVRTNLAWAVRLQLQDGDAAFVLCPGQSGTNTQFFGVLIQATRPPKK